MARPRFAVGMAARAVGHLLLGRAGGPTTVDPVTAPGRGRPGPISRLSGPLCHLFHTHGADLDEAPGRQAAPSPRTAGALAELPEVVCVP